MGLGDVLDTIGNDIATGAKAVGRTAAAVAPTVGYALNPELDQQKRSQDFQLAEQARAAKASQIANALQTMDEGPEKAALLQQYFDLYPQPKDAGSLMEGLRRLIHPKGATAPQPTATTTPAPMQETLGAPNAGTLAQMLGNVPAVHKGVKTGTYDISGEDLVGQHDVYGNPVDPKKVYRRETDANGREVGLIPTQPRTSGVPRVLPPIAMSAAKRMAEMGIPFVDEGGQPIDVTQFDNTMQLVPVKIGNHTAYAVTSQGQTHLTVGNVVTAVPRLEQTNLNEEGVPLGVARVPTTTTRQTLAVNPATGQVGIQPLTSTAVPATAEPVGKSPRPVLQPRHPATTSNDIAAAQQAAEAESQPTPTTAQALTAPPTSKAPKAKQVGGATKPTPAPPAAAAPSSNPALMPPGMYNQQLQVARPLRVVSNQIFGDPANPDFKPLSAYGDVLANPASVKRIATVSRLMIDDLASKDATKSGNFWTLLTTKAGLPQALAAAQAQQSLEALNKLTPREKEFVDAAMDTYGAVIGLRAITKGSAAKFSAQSLEREVPLPGFALPSDKTAPFQFYDKLTRLAEEVNSGAKGNAVLTPEEKNYYAAQFSKLDQQKEAARPQWSKSKYAAAHPGADVNAAAAEAKRQGRKVVE